MEQLRSLRHRDGGVELWAVIPLDPEMRQTFVVRGPEALPTEGRFLTIGAAEEEFRRRLQPMPRHGRVQRRVP